MGRPPRGTVEGVKRGPWSPEEDILLAVYIYEHGAGNWPAVPSNAGLRRCSQSCRLRWTNYLRPGIKRGDFTPEDDIRIIELQKLFGNSWSAIASCLPGRTDSDIKNHWNHKLKKKIQNRDVGGQNVDGASPSEGSNVNAGGATTSSKKCLWVTRLQNDVEYVKTALSKVLSSTSPAATSTTCAATPAVYNLPLTVVASSRPPPVSSGLVSFKPSSPNDYKKHALQVISDAQASNFPSSYPGSVENIARLLKNWTEKSSATAHVLIAETESQRKGDVFDNATHQGITNDQGTMNVDKYDDHAKVHYNTTNNSPVPLVVAAPVPFPPAISAVVPFPPPVSVPVPPPAIVSLAPTATALAPTATAPAPFDGDEEGDNYLPKLCMSLPFDQNVFWPFY